MPPPMSLILNVTFPEEQHDYSRGGQHLGAGHQPAEAEAEVRHGVQVDRVRAEPAAGRQQGRRQDDAHPPVRRTHRGAEADAGARVHLRQEEQPASR